MSTHTPCLLCGAHEAEARLRSRVQLAPAGGEVFRFVRCRRCGLVYLDPRPDEEEMGRFYPPGYLPHRGAAAWGRWARLVGWAEQRTDRRRVRWLLRSGPPALGPHRAVLDVGCGRPTFLELLRASTGARGVGLDVNDEGWRGAPEAWNGLQLLEGTVHGAVEPLRERAPSAGYSAVTLWHALEHDHRPLETLRTLRELTEPGAILLAEVPDASSLSARVQGSHWGGLHTPRHTVLFDPDSLRRMVTEAGWTVERHHRHGTLDPYVLWWLGRRARAGEALDGSLERRFPGYVLGRALAWPLIALRRWIPLGIQVVVGRRSTGR